MILSPKSEWKLGNITFINEFELSLATSKLTETSRQFKQPDHQSLVKRILEKASPKLVVASSSSKIWLFSAFALTLLRPESQLRECKLAHLHPKEQDTEGREVCPFSLVEETSSEVTILFPFNSHCEELSDMTIAASIAANCSLLAEGTA